MSLDIVPLTLPVANACVARWHRHHMAETKVRWALNNGDVISYEIPIDPTTEADALTFDFGDLG